MATKLGQLCETIRSLARGDARLSPQSLQVLPSHALGPKSLRNPEKQSSFAVNL